MDIARPPITVQKLEYTDFAQTLDFEAGVPNLEALNLSDLEEHREPGDVQESLEFSVQMRQATLLVNRRTMSIALRCVDYCTYRYASPISFLPLFVMSNSVT